MRLRPMNLAALALVILGCAAPGRCEMPSPWKAWEPVTVRGREARVWGRVYRLSDIGLPSHVVSAGREMLSGPARLEVETDGKAVRWARISGHWTRVGPTGARYAYRADCPGLTLKVSGLIEPDGMWRLDAELIPDRPMSMGRLRLVIPLRPRHAELMHWYPLPRNWPNVTFFDRAFQNSGARPPEWESPFTPFVWLGDEERGLQWFCETDEQWAPASAGSALSVGEADGAVAFTAHIVERPVPLSSPRRLTFGLQAGPVKPKSPLVAAGDVGYSHWATYKDTDAARLEYLKGIGAKFVGTHEDWTDYEGMPRVSHPEQLRRLADDVRRAGMGLVLYHSLALPDIAPEFADMADDWLCEPRTANYVHSRQPEQRDYPVCHRSSYPALWADGIEGLFKEYGISGLYLDGAACPIPCANSRHGCGYEDSSSSSRPTYPIFAARETMKRLRTICESQTGPALIVAHMSGMITLPSLSFADVLLTGEQYWKSPDDYRPPLEFFRTECMGHNHGIPTHFIGYPPLDGEYARTMIGLHNAPSPWCAGGWDMWRLLKDFDADGARFITYWAADPLAESDSPDVLVSGLAHPGGRALLAVGNLRQSAADALVTLGKDLQASGSAREPLTGERFAIESGRIELTLGAESLKWILLGPAE